MKATTKMTNQQDDIIEMFNEFNNTIQELNDVLYDDDKKEFIEFCNKYIESQFFQKPININYKNFKKRIKQIKPLPKIKEIPEIKNPIVGIWCYRCRINLSNQIKEKDWCLCAGEPCPFCVEDNSDGMICWKFKNQETRCEDCKKDVDVSWLKNINGKNYCMFCIIEKKKQQKEKISQYKNMCIYFELQDGEKEIVNLSNWILEDGTGNDEMFFDECEEPCFVDRELERYVCLEYIENNLVK